MSSKARSLLKRLRTKKLEEEKEKEAERPKSEEKRIENIKPLNQGAIKDEKSGKIAYIDPLDYFKTEHPLEVDKNFLDEYGLNESESEVKNEEKKENEHNKKPTLKTVIGAVNVKIKFEDMMKARNKIKKDEKAQTKKSLSVGTRNVKNEKNKFEIINKTKEDRDQRLYIKLILARNKFNKSEQNQQDVYSNILNKLSQLKGIQDNSGELKKEIDEIENNLKIKNIVLCPDVQIVSDEDDSDSIGKQMSLEQIINKMKLKSDY